MSIEQLKVIAGLNLQAVMKSLPGAKSAGNNRYSCSLIPKDAVNSLVAQLKKSGHFKGVTRDADEYDIQTTEGRLKVSEKGKGSLVTLTS